MANQISLLSGGAFSKAGAGFDFKPRVLAAETQPGDGRQPRGL